MKALDTLRGQLADVTASIDEMVEENSGEGGTFESCVENGKLDKKAAAARITEIKDSIANNEIDALLQLEKLLQTKMGKKEYIVYVNNNPLCSNAFNEKGTITKKSIRKRIDEIRDSFDVPSRYKDEYDALLSLSQRIEFQEHLTKAIKQAEADLDAKLEKRYAKLTVPEIKHLLVEEKWFSAIYAGIDAIHEAVSHRLSSRATELVERYEFTLRECEAEVAGYEAKVKSHLGRMGLVWM